MRISDWSSDVCSSDLVLDFAIEVAALGHVADGGDGERALRGLHRAEAYGHRKLAAVGAKAGELQPQPHAAHAGLRHIALDVADVTAAEALGNENVERPAGQAGARVAESPRGLGVHKLGAPRSEEHTSELQSLMRISY